MMPTVDEPLDFLASEKGQATMKKNRKYTQKKKAKRILKKFLFLFLLIL